jgi:hypothetical protein
VEGIFVLNLRALSKSELLLTYTQFGQTKNAATIFTKTRFASSWIHLSRSVASRADPPPAPMPEQLELVFGEG